MSRHKNKFIKSAQTPLRRRLLVIDFQNEIIEMYVRREGEEEGRENRRGRRFIRWVFDKRLRANQDGFYKQQKGSPWKNNFADAER